MSTKLNRNHLITGEVSYILPCLGRTEIDRQATGEQRHTTEDSTGCIRAWRGAAEPAGELLLSEPAIIARLAKATLAPNPMLDWDAWVADYSLIRDAIAEKLPEIFHDFNVRMMEPGGFHRPLGASQRRWDTETGKANFINPPSLSMDPDTEEGGHERHDVLQMMTLRSNDQFNTTVYGYDDRFRGIHGTRAVILMNRNDIVRTGLAENDRIEAITVVDDGVHRAVGPLRVTPYSIPGLLRRLLPRMQRPAAGLAPCRTQQGAGGQVDSGPAAQDDRGRCGRRGTAPARPTPGQRSPGPA